MRVLFVCLGNICRSPTAEGVLRHKLRAAGLADQVEVASAGTGDWHVGNPPDKRSQAAAKVRGYDLSAQRAQQVSRADFASYDLILAMDHSNLRNLKALQPSTARPSWTCSCAVTPVWSMKCRIRTTTAIRASSRCWT
jgi:protein-tyrosine phosphatase